MAVRSGAAVRIFQAGGGATEAAPPEVMEAAQAGAMAAGQSEVTGAHPVAAMERGQRAAMPVDSVITGPDVPQRARPIITATPARPGSVTPAERIFEIRTTPRIEDI